MQKGLFFYTNGFTGDVNDGAAPFSESEFRDYNRSVLTGNVANLGVLAGVDNELEVTGVASPLAVATGRAQVYGFHYLNDAAAAPTVTTPSVGDTGFAVVLRCNLTGANNPPLESQVRILVILNTDGNAAIPALVQTPDVTWDIPLATGVIDTSGDIWTDSSVSVAGVTDAREFARSPLTGLFPETRQGGDPVDWEVTGTTDYPVPFKPLMQIGRITTDLIDARATVVYDEPFAAVPFLFFQPDILGLEAVVAYTITRTATGFIVESRYIDGTDAFNMPISWMAIGVKV